MKTGPTRTRWAKQRRGIIPARLHPTPEEQEADAIPLPPEPTRGFIRIPVPEPVSPEREKWILTTLRIVAGGSRDQRTRAIQRLNASGYTDEEISAALAAETRRLEAAGDLLRNPPAFQNLRELSADWTRPCAEANDIELPPTIINPDGTVDDIECCASGSCEVCKR